ncbi:uncharacterized protein LOC108888259 [Lates japonicus]
MGNKSSPELTLSFLLITALCLEAVYIPRIIYYGYVKMNWREARLYCQKGFTDLTTWDAMSRFNLSEWLVENNVSQVWIGLHRDPEKDSVWKWINIKTGEGVSGNDYAKSSEWADGEPSHPDEDLSATKDCGSLIPATKQWNSMLCSKELQPLCYYDNLVVVNENKTWEEALSYCRDMTTSDFNYDILSPHYSDYSYLRERIYSRATTDEVWIGLRFLGGEWWLVSGEELNQEMLPECPSQWNHCGTLSKHDTNNWITRDCSERRNFICYGERKKK